MIEISTQCAYFSLESNLAPWIKTVFKNKNATTSIGNFADVLCTLHTWSGVGHNAKAPIHTDIFVSN